jgi:hypothetical protein
MEMQTASWPSTYEQALISIVRTLPTERVVQILDYARYIQSQTTQHVDNHQMPGARTSHQSPSPVTLDLTNRLSGSIILQ